MVHDRCVISVKVEQEVICTLLNIDSADTPSHPKSPLFCFVFLHDSRTLAARVFFYTGMPYQVLVLG